MKTKLGVSSDISRKSAQWQTTTFGVSTPTRVVSSPSQVDAQLAHAQAAIVLDHECIITLATDIYPLASLSNEILSPAASNICVASLVSWITTARRLK